MRLLTLTPLLLSTVVSVLAAPVPVLLGDDFTSISLQRRTPAGDKIYRGGTAPIVPKDEHNEIKKDKEGNYVHGGSGVSVTTNPGTLPHPKVREMDKAEAASKFHLTHTPTANDPGHHSLDIKPGEKFTPKGLSDHLSSGWKQTPAHERLGQIPAHNTDLKQKVQKLADKEGHPAQAPGGSHPASSSSHNQAPHNAPASQQHHTPAAPATPKTGEKSRTWAQVVAGNKSAAQKQTSTSHAGSSSHNGSQAASQGHTTPHQAPASRAGTPPPASHPGTSSAGHTTSHSTSQGNNAPHQAPPAHQGTSHPSPASPPARSWAQVAAAPPARKAAVKTQSSTRGKKP